MNLFGFDTSDPAGLQNAIKSAQPLFDEVENRLEGIISTNLDRIGKMTITIPQIVITIDIPGEPKATAVDTSGGA